MSQPSAAQPPQCPPLALRSVERPRPAANPNAAALDDWAVEVRERCRTQRHAALTTHAYHQGALLLDEAVAYRQQQWMAFQDGVADAFASTVLHR